MANVGGYLRASLQSPAQRMDPGDIWSREVVGPGGNRTGSRRSGRQVPYCWSEEVGLLIPPEPWTVQMEQKDKGTFSIVYKRKFLNSILQINSFSREDSVTTKIMGLAENQCCAF
ncbi:jg10444 [Pararge aegeria aegeria]|uniref:Jg10444 protein n=1 Tax=Pararge aegeria aegeria TaxID=348720 RepID=A0A8S4REH2_9NEOP|nr:jg10444 [Pararge aegeria aegeria]